MFGALPEINGTVWQNYMLVMTQWPTNITSQGPNNNGAPFPNDPDTELANTTMETYFQKGGVTSCMACHFISNQKGRDFVMFVTMDAFRPTEATPSDSFAEKTAGGSLFQSRISSLSTDPVVKSLVEFFDATRDQ